MRKTARISLFAALLLVVLFVGWLVCWISLGKRASSQAEAMQEASDHTFAFRFLWKSEPYEVMTLDIPTARDVALRSWAWSIFGNVSFSVIGQNGETVFWTTAAASGQPQPIHIEAGRYRLVARFSNVFTVGGAGGVDFLSYYANRVPVEPDTDGDGLTDEMEEHLGTKADVVDTDGDSLSDYAEVVKYGTNPAEADSDGDGTADSDWNERREYAYSVYVLLKIRGPFDPEAMNDLYQDVRVLEGPDQKGYTTIEAIVYPETRAVFTASPYPLQAVPGEWQPYLKPGIATNFGSNMQTEVIGIVSGATTDIQAVTRILNWVRRHTHPYLNYSIPEVYFTYIRDGKVAVRNYHDALPVEELLRTHYFAESMFKERTHGTCTSVATLKCAMLRAAGIPCRLIQTIFPIYYHGSQTEPYVNNLHRQWECSYEQPPGEDFDCANHAFLEVYLGRQWIQVDEDIGVYQQRPRCLGMKIIALADWSDVDFSEIWPVNWIDQRPYYTLLIEDQEPQWEAQYRESSVADTVRRSEAVTD